MNNIEDLSNRYQIIWDLGRRCSYSCTYCPPHRNNKWSPFLDYDKLCNTVDKVAEYALLYDQFRKKPALKKLSFTISNYFMMNSYLASGSHLFETSLIKS